MKHTQSHYLKVFVSSFAHSFIHFHFNKKVKKQTRKETTAQLHLSYYRTMFFIFLKTGIPLMLHLI